MLSSYPNPAHQHHAAGAAGPTVGGGHHGQLPQQQNRSLSAGGTPSMSFQQRQQGDDQNQLTTENGDQLPLKLLAGVNKVEDRSPTNNNINDRSDSNISDSADYDDEELDGDCRSSRSVGVPASAADGVIEQEPEALVVGSRHDAGGEQTTGLKRRERDDEAESAEGDGVDGGGGGDEDGESVGAERPPAAKTRRLHDDQARPRQIDLMYDGTDDIRADGGIDGQSSSSDAGSLSDGSRSPYDLHRADGIHHRQTEIIKTQRPLGLLAQHRIQTSASTMFRPAASSALRNTTVATTLTTDALSIGGAGLRLDEQQAAAAEQQRRFAELFCRPPHHFDERALGSMINFGVCPPPPTSLPPTPTSAGVVGLDYSLQASRFDSLMDRRFIPSPPLSTSPCSGQDEPASPIDASTGGHHRHWTFQEQFKQLYEMSDDQKRKEFLDELFTFMQKRGTPVNRIPIMAKQTLDLYELFRLVVSKGGLVEVINKKLWREITKGLNLPSSITSAAFTLRTQYMKYLYPFECEKLKLSTLAELQYAVDGNRREGRRPSYGGGPDFSPMSTPSLPSHPPPPGTPTVSHHMQQQQQQQQPTLMSVLGPTTPQQFADGFNAAALAAAAAVAARTNGLAFVTPRDAAERLTLAAQHQSMPTVNQLRTLAECDSRAMEAAARAMQEAMVKRIEEASSRAAAAAAAAVSAASTAAGGRGTSGSQPPQPPLTQQQMKIEDGSSSSQQSGQSKRPNDDLGGGSFTQPPGPPPPAHVLLGRGGVGAAHIKLTSRNDGRSEFDSSIVASMEVNGIVYQGVLFAQNPHLLGRI